MERLRFRSTSIVDLQAELRERDLLGWTERPHRSISPPAHRRPTIRWPFRRRSAGSRV